MCTAERSFIPFTRNTAHEEWIQFLSMIEAATPPGKQVHLIMDNYSAHKHAAVGQWLAEHPRFHVHWTPTSGSWLNAVERVFSDVTQKCLRRRSADSAPALEQAIGEFLDQRNENRKPLKWKSHRSGDLTQSQTRLG